MTLPKGVVFYTLTGAKGWSSYFRQTLDIARVTNLQYHKRLFKVFDRDCDYTLQIDYRMPTEETTLAPTFTHGRGGGSFGFAVVDTVKLQHLITSRYRTKEEVQEEVQRIRTKQHKFEEFQKQQYAALQKQLED